MRKYLPYLFGGIVLTALLLLFIGRHRRYDGTGTVHIEKAGDAFQLVRNGKPFTIKGASGSVAYLRELRDAGGNTVRFYDTLNFKQKLDSAQKYGIAVIADIPLPAHRKEYDPYSIPIQRERIQQMVERFVSQYKNHPALLLWVLGNEINYPATGNGKGFSKYFNELVRTVKAADPDHPVTTAIRQTGRHKILNLWYRSDLDLIAINTFGGIKELEKDLKQIQLLWDGPYLISEWNDEGPWKQETTKWGAPLEPTSSKKAERIASVYENHIEPLKERCLGNLIFYWGYKHERTHTWFSMFLENGERTPSVAAMEQIFRQDTSYTYDGPRMDFLMLNRYGPQESMLLTTGQINTADVFFDAPDCDSISISWEILPEMWTNPANALRQESKPEDLNYLILENSDNLIRFRTPEREGPYRLFTYIKDHKGNIATANFPFYAINQAHVQN